MANNVNFNEIIRTITEFFNQFSQQSQPASPAPFFAIGAGLIIFKIFSFLAFLVLIALLLAFFDKQVNAIRTNIEKNTGKSLLCGLLAVLLIVPIALLLLVSLVGIVLIPVWCLLVMIAAMIGYIAAAQFSGAKLLKLLKVKGKTTLFETLLGAIVLMVVGMVPVLGAIICLLAVLAGIGAVVLTRFGTQKA